MTDPYPPQPAHEGPDLPELLQDVEWLRSLARRLTRSEAQADDLAQRTWLAALLRPPVERGGTVRPWLAKVLRNEARMERRASRRRVDREQRTLKERGVESAAPAGEIAAELEGRFHLQQQLMQAVSELDEPYRPTVMARYFEGLTHGEIATQMGVSLRTVESRLRRGRELLRSQLDAEFGTRRAWSAMTLPLVAQAGAPLKQHADPSAASSTVSPTVPLGSVALRTTALLMTAKQLFIAAGLIIALAVGWMFVGGADPAASGDASALVREAEFASESKTSLEGVDDAGPRRTAPKEVDPVETQASAEVPAQAPLREATLKGRVFDVNGDPIVGEWVMIVPPLGGVERWRTESDGSFQFSAQLPSSYSAKVTPSTAASTTVIRRGLSSASLERGTGSLLVLAPAVEFRASIVNELGEPVAGATASIELPEGLRSRFPDTLIHTVTSEWSSESNAAGWLTILGAPRMAGCSLHISAQGYEPQVIESPSPLEEGGMSDPMELVLVRLDPEKRIEGVVRTAKGSPMEGARVGLGHALRTTDASGFFSFHLDGSDGAMKGPRKLVAAASGWSPTVFEPDMIDGEPSWPDRVELRLEQPTRTLTGLVLDREGLPLPGGQVWIDDPTFLGMEEDGILVTENLKPGWTNLWQLSTADEDGRFHLPELNARAYTLRAMDPATLLMSAPLSVQPTEDDVRIQLRQDVDLGTLEGTVRDARGEPLQNVEVSSRSTTALYRAPGASSSRAQFSETDPVYTDEKGRFRRTDVPLSRGQLYVSLKGFSQLTLDVTELTEPLDALELTLYSRCHARIVDSSDPGQRADRVSVRDALGTSLEISYMAGNRSSHLGTSVPLQDGISPTFWISDAGRELVYRREGKIIHTAPIVLTPGAINELTR